MSKIGLSRIPSLTFYKDAVTTARRGQPIPQLVCIGKPCDLYQPEVVRCTNIGGEGTDVDWKCEADLPEALRFGRVEVSCEGWSGPGDPYVLKGSCGLEYRLVHVPDTLRRPDDPLYQSRPRWLDNALNNPSAVIFYIIWTSCLLFLLYMFIKNCLLQRSSARSSGTTRPRPPGSGPSSGGGFPGGFFRPDNSDPPPPYMKHPSSSNAQNSGWQPGFWTGAALGGLGTYLLNRNQRDRPRAAAYDWEHDRMFRRPDPPPPAGYSGWSSGSGGRAGFNSDDRGEGPSNLGSMRRSTGLGGSNVR